MSCFLLSMNCKPCSSSHGGCKGGTSLVGRGHGLTGLSILDVAHAWLALLPWPDLGVPGYGCPVRLRERELTYVTTGPASPAYGYFKCKNTLNYMPSMQEINRLFSGVFGVAGTVSSPGTRKPQFMFSPLLESFPSHLAHWAAQRMESLAIHPSLRRLEEQYTHSTWSSLSPTSTSRLKALQAFNPFSSPALIYRTRLWSIAQPLQLAVSSSLCVR